MESLIRLICTPDRIQCMQNEAQNLLDLTRLSNAQLLRICDPTKLTCEELRDVLVVNTDNQIVTLFKKMFFHESNPLSVEDLKSIEFNKFGDYVQQCCLNYMLMPDNISIDKICVLLDQIRSVNYGKSYSAYKLWEINPLFFCCRMGKFDLIKLLVERYGANIEYDGGAGRTAIMYSAEDDAEITKYLYDSGARLSTSTHNINEFASKSIRELIAKWEADKTRETDDSRVDNEKLEDTDQTPTKVDHCDSNDMPDLELAAGSLKAELERLKQENDEMKRNYQCILNLLQNPK